MRITPDPALASLIEALCKSAAQAVAERDAARVDADTLAEALRGSVAETLGARNELAHARADAAELRRQNETLREQLRTAQAKSGRLLFAVHELRAELDAHGFALERAGRAFVKAYLGALPNRDYESGMRAALASLCQEQREGTI
jgi:chromosome segregation ATPase